MNKPITLKGNRWWSFSYALTSLWNYPVRNMGIALVLAIGITLPTTVFVWSASGTNLAVTNYFDENTYQLYLKARSGESYTSSNMESALSMLENDRFVSHVDLVASTIGILQGGSIPVWTSYSQYNVNYALGIKDMRVIFVTPGILERWSNNFEYQGQFSLQVGQVLVSERFIEYTEEVHGITIEIGSTIDLDLLRIGNPHDSPTSPSFSTPTTTSREPLNDLLVVGIYSHPDIRTPLTREISSISRKSWDALQLADEVVLGLADSVMILKEQVSEASYGIVRNRGYRNPVAFIRANQTNLIAAGPSRIAYNLESVKERTEELYGRVSVSGLSEIWTLDAYIVTFLQSQILTIVILPVLVMSLILTIFTSDSSISRRKGEVSALRAKGASFNQIFATFMWESVILGLVGFILGISLSFIMAPLVGASVGLFTFDWNLYVQYAAHASVHPLAIVIAAVIVLYLPIAYLLHVSRRIDVSEVGQPLVSVPDAEGTAKSDVLRDFVGLAAVLVALLALPVLISPRGFNAIAEILIATGLLFLAAFLGSKVTRIVVARMSGRTSFLIGEKSLYLSQSLRKRKGQLIPLLVILTLTLSTTTMMIIQSSSFEATLDNELRYALGADARVECDRFSIYFNESLLETPGVSKVMPVIQSYAQVGSNNFYLEGINPMLYTEIGVFSSSSFVMGTPHEVMSALADTENGIVISQYYASLWNRSIGETITVSFQGTNATRTLPFVIVGLVRDAPGFGVSSTAQLGRSSFGVQFGFQVGSGGFAFVNLDYLVATSYIDYTDLFLMDLMDDANVSEIVETLNEIRYLKIYTPETYDFTEESYSIQLFLSGIQGLTSISFILCAVMGLSAIALFLGSAVMERKQEYAIFRALGGTKRQVISMVFGEFASSVVTAILVSVLLGVVFGFVMSILTMGISPFSPILPGVLAFPFLMISVIVGLQSITMIASCYIPARRAGSVDPASILRNL